MKFIEYEKDTYCVFCKIKVWYLPIQNLFFYFLFLVSWTSVWLDKCMTALPLSHDEAHWPKTIIKNTYNTDDDNNNENY